MADEAEHFQSSPLKRPRLDFEHHNGFGHNPSNTQNLISPNNMIHAGGDGQMDTRGKKINPLKKADAPFFLNFGSP